MNSYQRFAARRMFARWSPVYEEEVTENAYSAASMVAESAMRALGPLAGTHPRIADIGIGTGLLAQEIYDSLPCRITGLDFCENMMAACAGRGITELLVRCDVGKEAWPLPDQDFDAVLAAGLFEYLTPSMAAHFMDEAARILKTGGHLVFSYIPVMDGTRKVGLWRGHSGTFLICSFAAEELNALLQQNGFEIHEHSAPFAGSVFEDGSSYDYRLIAARKI